MRADFHIHSVYSDGEKTPDELMILAKSAGVSLLSITDHDISPDPEEFFAFAKSTGLFFLPGIEFTTFDKEQIHILGYGCRRTEEYLATLSAVLRGREERNRIILKNLAAAGCPLLFEEIDRNASGFFGTAQIIRQMVRRGYVKDYADGMARYFYTGAPGYVKEKRLSPKEAVRVIRQAGGVPVLAHPGKMKKLSFPEQEKLIAKLKDEGLFGIESHYSSHTESETDAYLRLAKKYDLFSSVGSDFHGHERPEHVGTPIHSLTEEEIQKLCEAIHIPSLSAIENEYCKAEK